MQLEVDFYHIANMYWAYLYMQGPRLNILMHILLNSHHSTIKQVVCILPPPNLNDEKTEIQ